MIIPGYNFKGIVLNILLTGGVGYIGSHTAVLLAKEGHRVILFDDLSNSNIGNLSQMEKIIGLPPIFVKGDIRDELLLEITIQKYDIDSVIHFAGLKAVGESVKNSLKYYSCNVEGTLSLLKVMQKKHVKNIVFSSSATVYGDPKYLPLDEQHPIQPSNPYGRSKAFIEEILKDLSVSDPEWSIICLRYFNPVGAHPSNLIGENPRGVPNNLMPYIARVAAGEYQCVSIFGDNYDTDDGTGIRDYIHVMDLARGHCDALGFLQLNTGWHVFNLGTGKGTSVFELIRTFEKVSGKSIPIRISQRREGDIAISYADPSKARILMGWQALESVENMCLSVWDSMRSIAKLD